jgi:hypothetical protein
MACGPAADVRVDAATGDAAAPDGAMPIGGTSIPVQCTQFSRTVTQPNGARTEITVSSAHVSDVGVGDRYLVSLCFAPNSDPFADSCPVGATCTGQSHPPGRRCVSHSGGLHFIAGKLLVECSRTVETFDANGNMVSRTSTAFEDIQLTKF